MDGWILNGGDEVPLKRGEDLVGRLGRVIKMESGILIDKL
jgi:hypothetical protein